MTQPITCLNGSFLRADRAAIPLADRGFRFGDGVFETIFIHRGVPYQWELHMERLASGLAALSIAPPDISWQYYARTLIKRNKATEGFLRIAVSRGVGSRGYLPHPPGMPATWAIEYLPPLDAPDKPYNLWLSTLNKIPPQCLPTRHKLAQGLSSTLAAIEAQKNDCDDALQITIDGIISETSSANIFWISGKDCFTPSFDTGCLAGTTRDAVLRTGAIPIHMVEAGLSELERADAIFITNTRLSIHPIASIQPMGWRYNSRHPLIQQLQLRLKHDRDKEIKRLADEWK